MDSWFFLAALLCATRTPEEPKIHLDQRESSRQLAGLRLAWAEMNIPEQPPSFAQALRFWAWLGCVSFGGPAGQIAILHRELVEKRRWIAEERFRHALNYCLFLPGPEAQQLATYCGWLLHGIRGGLAAGLLFILPSLLLLLLLSWLYLEFAAQAAFGCLLWAVKPAVLALILAAAWRLASQVLKTWSDASLAAGAFLALALLQAPFPLIILAAALTGFLRSEAVRPGMPLPRSRDLPLRRLAVLLSAGLGLGIGVYLLLRATAPALAEMAAFFTRCALVSFGGAYAVLPYVQQAAVEQYQWLDAKQMLDGLALGESTPGPLIMIVAFVGFLGGWQKEMAGPGACLEGGVAGSLVATFFTFLPSFLFIFVGAPLIEAGRMQPRWQGPLAAIGAAVIGVILHLAWIFGATVFLAAEGFDLAAMLLGSASAWLLIRWQWSALRVIGLALAVGAGRFLLS
ncbi:MAG: hypothetical protein RL095_4138 [Verrucomicrobiota bacterium]|jgi:chromate transporter